MKTISISANTSWYLYNFRKNTILALLDKGYQVVVLAPRDEFTSKLQSIGCKYETISMDRGGFNPIKDLWTILCFLKAYIKYRPKVALNFTPKNNIYGTLSGKILRIKSINNIAGLGLVFTKDGLKSKLVKLCYKLSQPFAHRVFFQNKEDHEYFILNRLVKQEQSTLIPGSGVDLQHFLPKYTSSHPIIFLMVSRLIYEKGVQQFIEAARSVILKYDHVIFQLLGKYDIQSPSGIHKKIMDDWLAEGCVEYLGESNNVIRQISNASCIVLPSYYREGVPKSLLEGAAMGKPIITTDSIGCRDVVLDGINGYLCRPKSTDDLIEKIHAFLSLSDAQRLNMGKQSRKIAENKFDERKVIEPYLKAITETIGKSL